MKEQLTILYTEMQADVERCIELDLPEEERVECAFRVAQNYWDLVKKTVTKEFLENETYEIDFFRNIKPKFTSYIEYLLIIYEAVLFIRGDTKKQIFHWEQELEKYQRFCDKHKEFVDYYESRWHCRDDVYFTVKNFNPLNKTPKPYDNDLKFCTPYDSLVASLLANRMYFQFVNKRLAELKLISFKKTL